MIFVTVGSQKFQFNRLLMGIDTLIEKKIIKPYEVFAQTGYSTYNPKFYNYEPFLDKNDFIKKVDACEIIITHGGTGSIINGVKKGKKVIGIPRAEKYGEHVDNHQNEIIEQFKDLNLIDGVIEPNELEEALIKIKDKSFKKYKSNTHNIINILNGFLQQKSI